MNTSNGLLKRIYGTGFAILLAVAVGIPALGGESLWEPGFSGYVSPDGSVEEGDVVLIEIRPQSELSIESTHIDSEEARISISGGEGGGLFDFLPKGSSSSEREIEESDSLELETRMAVIITEKGPDGLLTVRGRRSLEINGLEEEIELSGKLSAEDLRHAVAVPFEKLADARLVYSGVGYGQKPPLTEEDLKKIQEDIEAQAEEAVAGEEAATQEANGETAGAAQAGEQEAAGTAQENGAGAEGQEGGRAGEAAQRQEGYELSEERRKELLVEYINRFVDLLFSD